MILEYYSTPNSNYNQLKENSSHSAINSTMNKIKLINSSFTGNNITIIKIRMFNWIEYMMSMKKY